MYISLKRICLSLHLLKKLIVFGKGKEIENCFHKTDLYILILSTSSVFIEYHVCFIQFAGNEWSLDTWKTVLYTKWIFAYVFIFGSRVSAKQISAKQNLFDKWEKEKIEEFVIKENRLLIFLTFNTLKFDKMDLQRILLDEVWIKEKLLPRNRTIYW